jgi:membrane protein
MEFVRVVKSALAGWDRNRSGGMSASLAFYSLLSLVPLVTVAMSVATFLLGSASARWIASSRIRSLFGQTVSDVFDGIVNAGFSPGETAIAATLGLVVLLSGVSGVASELRSSLNLIWGVETASESVKDMIKNRSRAVLLVLALSILVLAVSIVSVVISAAGKFVASLLPAPEWALALANFGVSLALLFAIFVMIHRFVPDADVTWRQAVAAAACTAFLFTIGKEIVTIYIGKSTVGSVFGPGRSVIILLLWAQFSAAVLFFGAEFGRAYATERALQEKRRKTREEPVRHYI